MSHSKHMPPCEAAVKLPGGPTLINHGQHSCMAAQERCQHRSNTLDLISGLTYAADGNARTYHCGTQEAEGNSRLLQPAKVME